MDKQGDREDGVWGKEETEILYQLIYLPPQRPELDQAKTRSQGLHPGLPQPGVLVPASTAFLSMLAGT